MTTSSDYEVRDEDRLPWLETVDEDYDQGPSVLRVVLMVILGLAIIAAAIFGYYWYQQHQGADGNGALIVAQEGDYKVKPDDPGGLKVEGEGEVAVATSDGAGGGNASIDLNATPETPVAGTKAAPAAPVTGGSSKAVVAIPASGGKLTAATPSAAPATGPASRGSLVQLGSFPDEGSANDAWARAAKRFTYLAPLGKSVQKAEVNGRTVFRLRVNAGSAGAASELCGRLKVAGEACFVAND
ncbi:MAG: SPOR domain-containing protein [Sphingomonas sp.]|jgi:hypothetical protein|uniref:SPOR domain-containing protein n=1 Tax=Sphingomonas sp. TaxID=28214 RepID=UPI0035616805